MKLYFEYLEQLNEADEKITQKEETLQEEISVGLEDSLRKYVKKFLKANARELEKELDRKGFVKLGDDLVREFSLMVDDYLEAAENYGKEDIEDAEFVEESLEEGLSGLMTSGNSWMKFAEKVWGFDTDKLTKTISELPNVRTAYINNEKITVNYDEEPDTDDIKNLKDLLQIGYDGVLGNPKVEDKTVIIEIPDDLLQYAAYTAYIDKEKDFGSTDIQKAIYTLEVLSL